MSRRLLLLAAVFALVPAADAAAYSLAVDPTTEGGPVKVTIARTLLESDRVTVVPVADGSATPGSDFDATSRTTTFPFLAETTTVDIPTFDDELEEPDETFTVKLEGSDATPRTATIADDDTPPALSIGDVRVDESAGSATLTVLASAASGEPITAGWSTAAGSATAEDFAAGAGTVSIPSGGRSATITIPIANDTADEDEESFRVVLTNAAGATVADGDATVTVADDDQRVVTADDATVSEGDSGTTTLSFPVRLNAPSRRTVTVGWATGDAQARAPADYLARLGTVTFAPGETRKTVDIGVVGDAAPEGPEAFLLRFTSVSGARLGRLGAVGVINDGDTATAARGGDRSAAAVKLAAPRLRGRRVRVKVGCPSGGETCDGRLSLYTVPDRRSKVRSLRRERRIGARSYSVAAGASKTVTYRLSAKLYRDARRAKRLRVRAYAVTLDDAGNADIRNTSATLRIRR